MIINPIVLLYVSLAVTAITSFAGTLELLLRRNNAAGRSAHILPALRALNVK